MIPEQLGFDSEQIIREVSDKIGDFEGKHQDKIGRIQSAWNLYKGIPEERRRRESDGLANTFVYETPRIVDALTTTQFRMIMAHDPPYEVRSQRGDIPEDVLYRLSSLKKKQFEWTQYPKNLYRTLKSCNLMGTSIIEQPWLQGPIVKGRPSWEATGFIPRPLNQVFFAPNAMDIEIADYIGTFDIVTKYGLNKIMAADPNGQAWNHPEIKNAIEEDIDQVPEGVSRRLMGAGFYDLAGMKELAVYHGPLESQNSYQDWVVGLVNRKHLVRFHQPLLPERPFRIAYSSYIEQEPFGLGIKDSDMLQKMLNSNRNRIFDLITFSLYSMFKVDRFAGLDVREARIRPWHFLFMDNIQGMEPMRPDLNAASFGLKLEEIMKDEFQSRTGATKNLQSIETDVTATEVNILMDQAMRKIGVDTQIMAESLLRQPLYYSLDLDRLFLDQPIWIAATGDRGPVSVTTEDMSYEIDFDIKISTDKDFRPNRLRRLNEFLQIFTSVRNDLPIPPETRAKVTMNLVEQGMRLLDIDPRMLKQTTLPGMQQAPGLADQAMQAFNRQQSRLGLLNKEAGLFGTPAPLPGISERDVTEINA